MPHDSSVTLSELAEPVVVVACRPCARWKRYNVAKLIDLYGGGARLTDLLVSLANCKKPGSPSADERCKAQYIGL